MKPQAYPEDAAGLTLWRAAPLDPFPGHPLGLCCSPAWHGAGHTWVFINTAWKQRARDPVSEERHYTYTDVCRAHPEPGTLGPVLTGSVSGDLLLSSASHRWKKKDKRDIPLVKRHLFKRLAEQDGVFTTPS